MLQRLLHAPPPKPAAYWQASSGKVAELYPLRALSPQQWRALTALYQNPELAHLNAAEPATMPHWLMRLALLSDAGPERGRAAFGVVEAGQLIGNAELYDFGPRPGRFTRATLGVMLARNCWGQGLGTAALQALLAYAFGHPQAPRSSLQLERVRLSTLQSNARAQRAFKRVGFHETGRGALRGHAMLDMEVTRSEWEAALNAPPPGQSSLH